MVRFFIPFTGTSPAALQINGHNLLLVSRDPRDMEECLGLFGADCVKSVFSFEAEENAHEILERLADDIQGDVIIAPEDSPLEEIVSELHEELPWLH
ncbi:hypothetical protein MRY87_12835 [bacterium]|nr:hypothetical protein [bacterium]